MLCADRGYANVTAVNLSAMTPPREKRSCSEEREREREKTGKKNDRRGMIRACKQCDSGGQTNERERTGIERAGAKIPTPTQVSALLAAS